VQTSKAASKTGMRRSFDGKEKIMENKESSKS
jgi:hypothetical protein